MVKSTKSPSELSIIDTACPLDCPDGCSLRVSVEAGKLVKVEAVPVAEAQNPITGGFICSKVAKSTSRVYSSERILTPLIRSGPKGSGRFEPATWEDAIGIVAGKIKDALEISGPDSIVPYVYNSSAGMLNQGAYASAFGNALGLPDVEHTVCAATMGKAKKLVLDGLSSTAQSDIVHAKFIVVWGANPTISNTHLGPLINRAIKENGAKLVVVDPRRSAIAARSDLHLALNPGTDVVLACAIANYLKCNNLINNDFVDQYANGYEDFFESAEQWSLEEAEKITGIEAQVIAEFAQQWATTTPATLRIGWGMERNQNGGSGIASVFALPILMGHFGVLGSGILHSTGSVIGADASALTGENNPKRKALSQNDLGEFLNRERQVEVLIVQGANPVVMNVDQNRVIKGLSREDLFTVVHEQVLTDTAKFADVIFPATTYYETADIVASYGTTLAQKSVPVIAPVGESRSNSQFWSALGAHFNLKFDPDPEKMTTKVTTNSPIGVAIQNQVQMVDYFPDSGKFTLLAPTYVPTEVNPAYPLRLLTPASAKLINSIFGESQTQAPTLHISDHDAASRNIANGDKVRVYNQYGSIVVGVSVGTSVVSGTVWIPKGFWAHSYGNTSCVSVNCLLGHHVEEFANGAAYNDAHVAVEGLAC